MKYAEQQATITQLADDLIQAYEDLIYKAELNHDLGEIMSLRLRLFDRFGVSLPPVTEFTFR